jgi:flavin reductase (DIM6/NTAB) family NADH-FMN oxidoreductase RutF
VAVSPNEFCAALSAFPAGVTIVTSTRPDGAPVGATVSAFMSLSLQPPLVVVSLVVGSRTTAAIRHRQAFVVHFVSKPNTDLALRFASTDGDKFDGLRYLMTERGTPALEDCGVRLDCSLYAEHEGGDHKIFVGLVEQVRLSQPDGCAPVAWFGRGFHRLGDALVS